MKRLTFLLSVFCLCVNSQNSINYSKGGISTKASAVPFLLIAPDARAGGMGNCGTASSPDANSMHWNAAKFAFIDKTVGASFSYAPWYNYSARSRVFQVYGSLYVKIAKATYLAASARYFELGSTPFTNSKGSNIGSYAPKESSLDLAFSKKLGNKLAAAITGRYIYSNLTNAIPMPSGVSTHIGYAWGSDISLYYLSNRMALGEKSGEAGVGLIISNIGSKISYIDDPAPNSRYPLPTQARIGGSFKIHFDDHNNITLLTDFSRLLIPSLPYLALMSEINNLNKSLGIEYSYNNSFMLRAGYNQQDSIRYDQKYLTLGIGCRYRAITFDLAYLIPVLATYSLQNTFRLTLSSNLSFLKKKETNRSPSTT